MKSDHEVNDVPLPSPPKLGESDLVFHLKSECELLRQRVRELETERERDRRQVAELESERDHYRAETYAWVRKAFAEKGIDEDDLKRRIEQEDGLLLEAFLGELERVATST
jgi:hypothetical protein